MGVWPALRLVGVGALLAGGLVAVTFIFPVASPAAQHALKRLWSRLVLRTLAIRLRVAGEPAQPGELLVSNHVSWLDVIVIDALFPSAFVAKADAADWPLIGALMARCGTLFLRRGSARDAWRVNQRIKPLLAAGERVAVFPEATTSDGAAVLPFYRALLQPAVDGGHPVRPLALRYRAADGNRSAAAAFIDGDTLMDSLIAVCSAPGIVAQVCALPPIPGRGATRRTLTEQSRRLVSFYVSDEGSSSLPRWRDADVPAEAGSGWDWGRFPESTESSSESRAAVSRA